MKKTTYLLLAMTVFVVLFASACGGLPPLQRKPHRPLLKLCQRKPLPKLLQPTPASLLPLPRLLPLPVRRLLPVPRLM